MFAFITIWEIEMVHTSVNNEFQFSSRLVAAGVAYLSNTSLSLALHRYSTASTHPLQSCTYPWSGNSREPGIRESPGAT